MIVNFPNLPFNIKKIKDKDCIYDVVRKKYVVLTPEEWVRQNMLQYLIHSLNYPKSIIAVEKKILINHQTKRFDIVVFKQANPWLIIECKQPEVTINDNAITQLLSYNSNLQAAYLCISNGQHNLLWQVSNQQLHLQNMFPKY